MRQMFPYLIQVSFPILAIAGNFLALYPAATILLSYIRIAYVARIEFPNGY